MGGKSKKEPDTRMTTVTLVKPHTHAGVQYQPGDQLEVSVDRAQWMEKLGIIHGRRSTVKKQKDEEATEG